MRRRFAFVFSFLAILLFLVPRAALGRESEKPVCTKRYAKHDIVFMSELFQQHWEWLNSGKKKGRQASLVGDDLDDAVVRWGDDLRDIDLRGSSLRRSILVNTNLEDSDFSEAESFKPYCIWLSDLSGSDLRGARLKGARFTGADLRGVTFEPVSPPEAPDISEARNLAFLTYFKNPDPLRKLGDEFKAAGFDQQERAVTYALNRRQTDLLWEGCNPRALPFYPRAVVLPDRVPAQARQLLSDRDWGGILGNCSKYLARRVFMDLTCQYGMSPSRPLLIILVLGAVCSLVYFLFMHSAGRSGIYLEVRQRGKVRRVRIRWRPVPKGVRAGRRSWLAQELKLTRVALYFSLLTAFRLGVKDLNIGEWLQLLITREYDVRGTLLVRALAGMQTLLSAGLLALSLLAQFGHPFA